ncbi:MAG: Dipeptide transport system permease protein [Chloroflexi bacterium]|nr:Dipeptide transport system permease protein [Chloroflexota bacterium]
MFVLARIVPGDPGRLALGPNATNEQVRALDHDFGIDQPLWTQYTRYIGGAVHGDFGTAILTRRNVFDDLRDTFPATLELVLASTLLVVVLGVPLGVLAALNRDGPIDTAARLLTLFGVAVPDFLVGIALQIAFGYSLGILPITGQLDPNLQFHAGITGMVAPDALLTGNWHVLGSALTHLILPSIALAVAGLSQVVRLVRASMIEVLRREHVRAMELRGVPRVRIAFKYALKPALIPALTIVGLTFASLFGEAFLIEAVFGWPGVASYGVRAMLEKDLNAIVGVVLIVGVMFSISNLAMDLLRGYLDPRIRLKGTV